MQIFLSTATIYDDGTNKIMLKFAFDPKSPSVNNGRELLGVSYAKMYPVRSSFELPATERIKVVGKTHRFTIPDMIRPIGNSEVDNSFPFWESKYLT